MRHLVTKKVFVHDIHTLKLYLWLICCVMDSAFIRLTILINKIKFEFNMKGITYIVCTHHFRMATE